MMKHIIAYLLMAPLVLVLGFMFAIVFWVLVGHDPLMMLVIFGLSVLAFLGSLLL